MEPWLNGLILLSFVWLFDMFPTNSKLNPDVTFTKAEGPPLGEPSDKNKLKFKLGEGLVQMFQQHARAEHRGRLLLLS